MACINTQPPRSPSALGSFPHHNHLPVSSRQIDPPSRIPRPLKSQGLSPKGARAWASSALRLRPGVRPWPKKRPRRAAARLPKTEGRAEGSSNCGRPETWTWSSGGSRVSRLTQQQSRPECGRHLRLTAPYPLRPPRPGPAPWLPQAQAPLQALTFGVWAGPQRRRLGRRPEEVGSQGSGCLFSGSLPAPHAGLHTAPHTPLRTALLRLAHAANQRAELRGPIRVAQRRAAQLERGAGRGGLLPRRAAAFPAVPRARPFPPGTSAPDRSRALPAKFQAPRDPVLALVIFRGSRRRGMPEGGSEWNGCD